MPRQISTAESAPRKRNQPAPRTPEQALAELRGLGGLVLEQALLDNTTRPLGSLLEWTDRLAAELGEPRPGRASNYPELLRVIVAISRRAGDPRELTVA
jgi:hypothetical protein